jgi:hypothetical protein
MVGQLFGKKALQKESGKKINAATTAYRLKVLTLRNSRCLQAEVFQKAVCI